MKVGGAPSLLCPAPSPVCRAAPSVGRRLSEAGTPPGCRGDSCESTAPPRGSPSECVSSFHCTNLVLVLRSNGEQEGALASHFFGCHPSLDFSLWASCDVCTSVSLSLGLCSSPFLAFSLTFWVGLGSFPRLREFLFLFLSFLRCVSSYVCHSPCGPPPSRVLGCLSLSLQSLSPRMSPPSPSLSLRTSVSPSPCVFRFESQSVSVSLSHSLCSLLSGSLLFSPLVFADAFSLSLSACSSLTL